MGSRATVDEWVRVSMILPVDAETDASSLCFAYGALGVETVDRQTLSYRDLPAPFAADQLQLIAYFSSDFSGSASADLNHKLQSVLVAPPITESFPSEDWQDGWKRHFGIQTISDLISVVPAWIEVPDPEPLVCIRINPGGAFGTGTHQSTRLALRVLEERLLASLPDSLLDVGCGSGILSIAAVKFGVKRVVGIDNDPHIFENARENAELSGVGSIDFKSTLIDALNSQFPIVVANIIAPILIEISTGLVARVETGGRLLLSGILARQTGAVISTFEALGGHIQHQWRLDEWTAIEFQF